MKKALWLPIVAFASLAYTSDHQGLVVLSTLEGPQCVGTAEDMREKAKEYSHVIDITSQTVKARNPELLKENAKTLMAIGTLLSYCPNVVLSDDFYNWLNWAQEEEDFKNAPSLMLYLRQVRAEALARKLR